MTINIKVPQKFNIKPTITVFGVGGAGGNAVNNMIASGLEGAKFIVANTDAQSLDNSLTENRLQLGETITQGLGAGSYPEVGKAAAEETADTIIDTLQDSNMVFITAGMGGGTGTGAAPVIARLAREQGVLTVAVVTKPFHFEGSHRMRVAELGLQELQKYVDTLVVIPNQNLFRVADKSTTFADAFKMADNVLSSGIRSITDLMVMPGLINLDFADIRSVMSEMGKAMMGTGHASGENRASEAAEAAISNPLLDNVSMKGARGVLINITGGPDLTLFEVDEAANRIREEVDSDANIIFGSTFDESLEGKIRVSIVATGIETESSSNVTPLFGKKTSAVSAAQHQADESDGEEAEFNTVSQIQQIGEAEEEEYGATEDGAFIAPRPLEADEDDDDGIPGTASAPSLNDNQGLAAAERPFAANAGKSARKGLGFFSRFASKEDEQAAAPAQQESRAPAHEQAKPAAEKEVKIKSEAQTKNKGDDFLDIPAFMRRKSK